MEQHKKGYWDAIVHHFQTGARGPAETDGEQHFRPVSWSASVTPARALQQFKEIQHTDALKTRQALDMYDFLIRVSFQSKSAGVHGWSNALDYLHNRLVANDRNMCVVDSLPLYQCLHQQVQLLCTKAVTFIGVS